jgi:hypothetical protein
MVRRDEGELVRDIMDNKAEKITEKLRKDALISPSR